MAFFNKGRRELISKTLMNILQILIGASFAGEVFLKFPNFVKIIAISSTIILFVLGIIICPEKKEE